MNRRDLLRGLLSLPVALTFDPEKLLWVPGEKVYFLPPLRTFTVSEIVAMELERIRPSLRSIFERDDVFYTALKSTIRREITEHDMRFPIQLTNEHWPED